MKKIIFLDVDGVLNGRNYYSELSPHALYINVKAF